MVAAAVVTVIPPASVRAGSLSPAISPHVFDDVICLKPACCEEPLHDCDTHSTFSPVFFSSSTNPLVLNMGQATEQGTKAWAADQQADDHDTEDEPFEDEFSVENIRDFIVARLAPYIPREYRYAEGIHEVRAKIFGQYGAKLYSKAMGIFYDLLESDDTASGHGDDGDVWRSWRHDFKNRKNDLVNPDTPRFSNFVLPAEQSAARKYLPPKPISLAVCYEQLENAGHQAQVRRLARKHMRAATLNATAHTESGLTEAELDLICKACRALVEERRLAQRCAQQSKDASAEGLWRRLSKKLTGLFRRRTHASGVSTSKGGASVYSHAALQDQRSAGRRFFCCGM